eukprot:2893567-Prorocentrum_lima.AAC.1
MTSSLVGSEMCIRDRAHIVWDQVPVQVQKGDTDGCAPFFSKNHKAVAVSYTHLTLPTICSV